MALRPASPHESTTRTCASQRWRRQRCLRHRNMTDLPKHVNPTSSVTGRSWIRARIRLLRHDGAKTLASTVTLIKPVTG